MPRTVLGLHPTGGMGLFIAKPGVDVDTVNTNNVDNLHFSSNWAQSASIIQTGTCSPEVGVAMPDQGFIPLIRWEAYQGQRIDIMPTTQFNFKSGDNFVVRRLTKYKMQYNSGSSFSIVRQRPDIDDNAALVGYDGFRYIVYNIAVDRAY